MNKKPLHVLLVEDNAGDARLLREMFSKEKAGSFELSHLTHMRFFVVAYTQPPGAEIIGRRILGQLREHEEFQSNEFTFAVSHSFLPPMARGADESMEMFVEQVAAEVRDHINDGCLQGEI